MAAIGKKKRSPSSSSSSFPTYSVMVVVFVGFCGLGAWMFTSSPLIPSRLTKAIGSGDPSSTSGSGSSSSSERSSSERSSTVANQNSPPAMEDTQGELPEEAIKGDNVSESGEAASEDSKSDDGGGVGGKESEQQEQTEKEESHRDRNGEVEEKKDEEAEDNQQMQQQKKAEEQIHEEQQKEHDEQLPEQEQEQEQKQQQQQQQQQNESTNDNSQPEIEKNQVQIQQNTEEVTEENKDRSDNKMEQNPESEQSELPMEDESRSKNSDVEQQSENEGSVSSKSNYKTPWDSPVQHSDNENERRWKGEALDSDGNGNDSPSEETGDLVAPEWKLCNVTPGADYIPCLDNEKAIKKLHSMRHYEHRERHCPESSPTCLVPLPNGYTRSIPWPSSRDKIWYNNVPHAKLAEVKGHQNWVKVTGEYLSFPGGGTQFIHGALSYIDFLQRSVPDISWGNRTRVILDVGCGVASFGGYIFERDVLTMSFAPKDEHEAQVQFALERGIPAISAVMGTQRLPFPSNVFDIVHCARCRVPWHADGGILLLELNRVLRPGGYFVWSATPVYQKLPEDVEIWNAMKVLTKSMCWSLVTIQKDTLNSIGAAFYRKPNSNECYNSRKQQSPPMCKEDDDKNAAWYIPLKACMHSVPIDASERGKRWPKNWPNRLRMPPYWLNKSQLGFYGKPAPGDFVADYKHWQQVLEKSYLTGLGISWSNVRNVMDMRAVYGGFAAALKDKSMWVMNVVNINDPDTLPIIYERGLFGIYHDWCESFSTYPRTYDLLHADRLFSSIVKRCSIVPVIAEVDRIVRPGGKFIVRDDSAILSKVESLMKSLQWEITLTYYKDQKGILCAEKTDWRPREYAATS